MKNTHESNCPMATDCPIPLCTCSPTHTKIGEETTRNKEWFDKGRNQVLDSIMLEVEIAKVAKEATKINPTGQDIIFVYDLKKIITKYK